MPVSRLLDCARSDKRAFSQYNSDFKQLSVLKRLLPTPTKWILHVCCMRYQKKYWVYMIHCKDNSIYTGISSWIELRFMQHEAGSFPDCYTFNRRPLKLVYGEAFDNPLMAIAWEKRIKKWSRGKKWALIEEKWDKLKELSVCQNHTHYRNYHKSNLDPTVTLGVEPVTSSAVSVTSSADIVTSSEVEKSTDEEVRSSDEAA